MGHMDAAGPTRNGPSGVSSAGNSRPRQVRQPITNPSHGLDDRQINPCEGRQVHTLLLAPMRAPDAPVTATGHRHCHSGHGHGAYVSRGARYMRASPISSIIWKHPTTARAGRSNTPLSKEPARNRSDRIPCAIESLTRQSDGFLHEAPYVSAWNPRKCLPSLWKPNIAQRPLCMQRRAFHHAQEHLRSHHHTSQADSRLRKTTDNDGHRQDSARSAHYCTCAHMYNHVRHRQIHAAGVTRV